ncbi:DUF3304 domain-containing protein [Chromobacterium sphagni]|uniref:DUF3304 domain-containing protein n=1 Tax=Chromobacterium sphagni TaxID=1903179 RepID=UPI001113F6BF|nr:DUF3304 domain-containing protein [Chromobacterium sphagni]
MKPFIFLLITIFSMIFLQGCEEKKESSSVDSPMQIFNYTDHVITSVWINGEWAGRSRTNENGGTTCCVSIPATYRLGITMIVNWERNACTSSNKECYEKYGKKDLDFPQVKLQKTITLPPYDTKEVSELQIAFLPNDEVRVYADNRGFERLDHPSVAEFGNLLQDGPRPLEKLWVNITGKQGASN